jgi:beta propeller repeat protein
MLSRCGPAMVAGVLLLLIALGQLAGASVQEVKQSERQVKHSLPSISRLAPVFTPTPTSTPVSPPSDTRASRGAPPKVKLQGPAWPPPTPSRPLVEAPITPTVMLPKRFLNAIQDVTSPIIEHPASLEFPRICGNRVVWQDARYGPTDIFMADLDTGEVENVTASDTWEVLPDIDDDIVVWKDGYNGIGIHGINLATHQVTSSSGLTIAEGSGTSMGTILQRASSSLFRTQPATNGTPILMATSSSGGTVVAGTPTTITFMPTT